MKCQGEVSEDYMGKKIKDVSIKYLPPYSPELNPIEKMWSRIKSILRKLQPRNFFDMWRSISVAHLDVTAKDALGWYEACGYFNYEFAIIT